MMITWKLWHCHIVRIEANIIRQYYLFPHCGDDDHFAHWRTNSIAFMVSRTLLSLYYQVKLIRFSGCKLTASMSRTVKRQDKISTAYDYGNYYFKLTAASRGFACYLQGFLVFLHGSVRNVR